MSKSNESSCNVFCYNLNWLSPLCSGVDNTELHMYLPQGREQGSVVAFRIKKEYSAIMFVFMQQVIFQVIMCHIYAVRRYCHNKQ